MCTVRSRRFPFVGFVELCEMLRRFFAQPRPIDFSKRTLASRSSYGKKTSVDKWAESIALLRSKIPLVVTYPEALRIVQNTSSNEEAELLLGAVISERWIGTGDYESIKRLTANTFDKTKSFSLNFFEHSLTTLLDSNIEHKSLEHSALVNSFWKQCNSKNNKYKPRKNLQLRMIQYFQETNDSDSIMTIASTTINPSGEFLDKILKTFRDLKAYSHQQKLWELVLRVNKNNRIPISPFFYKNALFALIALQDFEGCEQLISHFNNNLESITRHTSLSRKPAFWSSQIQSFYKTCISFYSQTDQLELLERTLEKCEALDCLNIAMYHIIMLRCYNSNAYEKVESLWQSALSKRIKPDGELARIYLLSLQESGKLSSLGSALEMLNGLGIAFDEDIYLGIIKGFVKSDEDVRQIHSIIKNNGDAVTAKIIQSFIVQISKENTFDSVLKIFDDTKVGMYGMVELDISVYNTLLKISSLFECEGMNIIYSALLESGLVWDKETFLWVSKMR